MTLRQLPSVDSLLGSAPDLVQEFGRPLTLAAVRAALESARDRIHGGAPAPGPAELLAGARADLERRTGATLRPVVNATGVILHTNLGRSLLSEAARAALLETASHYTTLEYDLAKGERGSRSVHAEYLLTQLTGAEAALVVNNAAAALLLALTVLARGREVIVSRGQLIEIGGGFRLPEVMRQSGAKLVEVGTTNRTRLPDVQAAVTPRTAAVLRAHHSNFKIIGFTAEPSLAELAAAAGERGLPLIDDLGSGALLDTAAYGLAHEPTVMESVQAGAGLVIFSGDKLLGGPQAGLIVGHKALVDRLNRHPLTRALRADKLTLAPLAATLLHYLKDEAAAKIPVWRMISLPLAAIEARAARWAAAWGGAVVDGQSTVGGGSLPGETLPTRLAVLDVPAPGRFLAALREPGRPGPKPIIARVEAGRVLFDPRTVLDDETAEVEGAVADRLHH